MRRSRVAPVAEAKGTVAMPSECRWACVSDILRSAQAWHAMRVFVCVCVCACMCHVFVRATSAAKHGQARHVGGRVSRVRWAFSRGSSVSDLADCMPVSWVCVCRVPDAGASCRWRGPTLHQWAR
jgi:hypothetical protein